MNYKIAYGITSRTEDNAHVFFSDIDKDLDIDVVKAYCRLLQKHFGLSDIHIIKSNNGYNLASFDKLPIKLVYQINHSIPYVDKAYNYLQFMNRGSYTLRTLPSSDKKYVCTVHAKDGLFVRSNSHRVYFSNLFKIDIFKDASFDDSEYIELCRFKNTKYGWRPIEDG